METVHEIISKPDLSRFCVCFCIEEGTPLFSLLGTPHQESLLLLWCNSGVAPRWLQLRYTSVERRFRDFSQPARSCARVAHSEQVIAFPPYTVVHEAEVPQMRTRTRTNTNPNDTEANAAGRILRACVARKSKS